MIRGAVVMALIAASGCDAPSFNHAMREKAAPLIGRPVSEIGPPDNILEGANGARSFEYYPTPLLPFSKFQVHTDGQTVISLEEMDD